MDADLLKHAIEDAKAVRQTAKMNAMNALNQAFTSGYVLTASYASTWNSGGYQGAYCNPPACIPDVNGIIRYTYNNDREEEEILDHIEKEGMVILDESDEDSPEKPHWYEVIKTDDLKKSVDNINSLDVDPLTVEELEETIDELDQEIMEIEKTQPKKSITFKDLVKQTFEACKREFL